MKRRARWFGNCCWCLLFLALATALPSCRTGHADALTEVRNRGALRWGGDEEGGGPYIFRPDDKPTQLTGFEVDLMALLSSRLSVTSDFRSSNWPELLNTLNTSTIDVVVNGYELTPARLQNYLATIPYYVYELHLFVRKDDARVNDWADIHRPKPGGGQWRIGVLKNTEADAYLTREFADGVDVRRYEGTTDAFRDVQAQTLDGTVTDTPAAVFYGPKFPVRQAGRPAQRGYYVMYVRPTDQSLRDALNDGLRAALQDGRLKALYQKYSLWTEPQEQLALPEVQGLPDTLRPADADLSNWQIVRNNLPLLIRAAGMTVLLSVLAMPLAIAVGLLIALGRVYGRLWLRTPLAGYVEIVRGTPLLLQLYFIHFGIVPRLGLPDEILGWASVISAVLGLALNYAAYEAEIYRAGLQAIPIGQMEAALALGLTRRQAIWHVVVPQAVRLVIPPVTNDFINLFKDTSICSVIAVEELTKRYSIASNGAPRAFVELALMTAILYLAMSYPLALLTRRLEKKTVAARA